MKMRSRVRRSGRKSLNLKASRQQGQVIVEYVLLLVVVLGVARVLVQGLNQMDFIQTLTYKPWAKLDGMIQCGVWQACGTNSIKAGLHPEDMARAISLRPRGTN